jgi:hypothetical protein
VVITPVYFGRGAAFVIIQNMTSPEADEGGEDQARRFDEHKDYLLQIWSSVHPRPPPIGRSASGDASS